MEKLGLSQTRGESLLNPSTTSVKLPKKMKFAAPFFLLIALLMDWHPSALAEVPAPGKHFGDGYAHFSSGKYSQAREFFQKALDPNYPLADYSLYYLALIAFHEADGEASRQLLSQLRQQYPQSIWYHTAELQRVKIDIAEGKYAQAGETLRVLQGEKNLQNEIFEEALYLRAQIQERQGDLPQAFSLYLELRNLAPHAAWAAAARKAMVL